MKTKEDGKLKSLLAETTIQANENLEARIMHQIQVERMLQPKKQAKSYSIVRSMWSVFGVMYAVIVFTLLIGYYMYGKSILQSTTLYMIIILVVSVCSMYWMISIFDEKRRNKNA